MRKLSAAKEVGFAGVVVWNSVDEASEASTLGGLVNPSVDESDRAYAERELDDVAIVVIGREDGAIVDAMTSLAESQSGSGSGAVLVEVFRNAPPLIFDDEEGMDGSEGVEEVPQPVEEPTPQTSGEEQRPRRILYINGFALRNTLLV